MLKASPDAGFIAGTLHLASWREGYRIDVGAVDFTAVHWVALAHSALKHAAEKLLALQPDDDIRDCMKCIEWALAALSFEELPPNA